MSEGIKNGLSPEMFAGMTPREMYAGLDNEQVRKEVMLQINTYKMYEEEKKEAARAMREKLNDDGTKKYTKADIDNKILELTREQNSALDKLAALGVKNPEELVKSTVKKKASQKTITDFIGDTNINIQNQSVNPGVENREPVIPSVNVRANDLNIMRSFVDTELNSQQHTQVNEAITTDTVAPLFTQVQNTNNGFDIIPLPSKGECYRNKMSRVPVTPLCANDENMIQSTNLYKEGLVLDYILKAKIANNEIDPIDMIEGDREAILFYLRADGYGYEYPISAKDNVTGERFDTSVDLSQLKYKPFNLVGDVNGWFSYTLPYSKHELKFKFLTHRDILALKRSEEAELNNLKKERLGNIVADLDSYIDSEENLQKQEIANIRRAIRTIDNWRDSIEEEELSYTHLLTNTVELSIMSVDLNTDRGFIHDFVRRMNIKDAKAFRKFIRENEPGIDYHFTVEKPASLGGGSQEVFLQFDKYLFLNDPDK